MVKGAPDHFKGVALYAWDGSKLVLIKVDSDGQLYTLLMGDASGTPTAISVTADGELYAALKAVYNSSKIDVLADVDGNLTLNLKAQDLSELINRPYYGAAGAAVAVGATCLAGVPKDIVTMSGQGVTYGGHFYISETWNDADLLRLVIDGTAVESLLIGSFYDDNFTIPSIGSSCLQRYDVVTPKFVAKLPYGLTFETSYVLRFTASVTDRDVNCRVLYAVV